MPATPWLTVVGALPSGTLAPGAPRGVLAADAVFGPQRLLDAAGVDGSRARPWPRPLACGVAQLLARRGSPTTVIASGDPLHHGIAATLLADVPAHEMAVFPAPSAFSLAAAALCWPLADVRTVSLHTAPCEAILAHVAQGRRILALTRDGAAPSQIAAALTRAGWGESPVAVAEALGGPEARVRHAAAATLAGEAHALNVLAVECRSAARPPVRAADLTHDGCVTRDEVRLLTIAALAPPGHLWDVGAGSGAVAIDWCRAGGSATLFERDPGRVASIHANLGATGTRADVLEGDALEALAAASTPSHVFMGGAVGSSSLFAALWDALPSGGTFVSNAVTLGGEAATLARHAEHGGALTRIALSHSAPVGGLAALRPAMPVLQWRAVKP